MFDFKKELHKVLDPLKRDVVYVGTDAYIRLGDVRVKVQIITTSTYRHYDAVRLTAINRTDGEIDKSVIEFLELWGMLPTTNPNFRGGVAPHIWDDTHRPGWYVSAPSPAQYKILTKEVEKYVSVFE